LNWYLMFCIFVLEPIIFVRFTLFNKEGLVVLFEHNCLARKVFRAIPIAGGWNRGGVGACP